MNLICLWCGKETSGVKTDDGREHIFPESIGGKETLHIGAVCKQCNNQLSFLDNHLKKGHPAMMDSYQVDSDIKGKKASGKAAKEKIERRLKEKNNIGGTGEEAYTTISRSGETVYSFNANYEITSELFVRALHKCMANLLCDKYGSIYVRENYSELLCFVQNGGDVRAWGYAVSYPELFSRVLCSVPRVVTSLCVKVNDKIHKAISFIHTSGIWVVTSSPFMLNKNVIEAFSGKIIEQLADAKEPESGKPITDFFGFERNKKARSYIGQLKLLWLIKEIEGKPNDEFLYLLTRCKVCGQTNPTGITFPRNIIYEGNTNDVIGYPQNTWNHYIVNDLKELGFKVEKWGKESIKRRMNKGISIPTENDVKKHEIIDCKCQCISCENFINFNASDSFL